MKLQVKKLTGPDEIIVNGNQNYSERFTVEFNRSLQEADFPVSIGIKIYNNDGNERVNLTGTLKNSNQIHNGDSCYFTLNAATLNSLTGTFIYIHVTLQNGIISKEASAYHETTKRVQLSANKQIKYLYWSNQEVIDNKKMDEEENCIASAYANEDVFIHIKAQGMYNDRVNISIFAGEQTTPFSWDAIGIGGKPLIRKQVQLSQNRKVIAISMADVRARYNQLQGNTNNDQFNIFVMVDTSNYVYWSTPFASTQSESLSVQPDETENPIKKTSTGTVYVNVNDATAEIEAVTPTEYRDFKLGYVGHLLSAGSIHQGIGGSWSKSAVVLYPFNFYELRLSDLVACNVLTIEDARTLTLNSENNILRMEQYMLENFKKHTPFNGESMIQRISNGNNRIDSGTVKKILDYVRRDDGRGIHSTYEVCRDAWQTLSSGLNAIPATRYESNGAECPPGAYTINLVAGGTYQVYFSNTNIPHSTSLWAGTNARGGLAIHRGDAYFATGCTTLYCPYSSLSEQKAFVSFLFNTQTPSQSYNNKRLILAYIEERNALLTQNYKNRWYDLVAPGRITTDDGIIGSRSVNPGTTQSYSLSIRKDSLAPNDTIASEEIASIRWLYKIGNGEYQEFAAGNGQTQIVLPIENSWARNYVTLKANITTSRKYVDKAQITINVSMPNNR